MFGHLCTFILVSRKILQWGKPLTVKQRKQNSQNPMFLIYYLSSVEWPKFHRYRVRPPSVGIYIGNIILIKIISIIFFFYEKKKKIKKRPSFMPARCHSGFGPPADLGPRSKSARGYGPPLQI